MRSSDLSSPYYVIIRAVCEGRGGAMINRLIDLLAASLHETATVAKQAKRYYVPVFLFAAFPSYIPIFSRQ